MKKIDKLRLYRSILIECKKLMIINSLNQEVERKIPTYGKSDEKVKVLTLFKRV